MPPDADAGSETATTVCGFRHHCHSRRPGPGGGRRHPTPRSRASTPVLSRMTEARQGCFEQGGYRPPPRRTAKVRAMAAAQDRLTVQGRSSTPSPDALDSADTSSAPLPPSEGLPATMMALRAHARGGPEMLVYEEAPVPSPVPGELIIEVHAAGITFAEFSWDETWQRDGRDRTPTVPSHEVSGVVTAVGPGVTRISVGDDVYGLVPFDRDGAAAEYVAVPADHVAPKPSSVSHPV